MNASYLIRFDDICPTMKWDTWFKIEQILHQHNIKPIIAVVPNNLDPDLVADKYNDSFWNRIRHLQNKGWTIGLHGYTHIHETTSSGIMGINKRSEFAGLPLNSQEDKINKALSIFSAEKINPECWIAPSHSFDSITVEILVKKGIKIISDGFFVNPIEYLDATWIPQQLWKFETRRKGLWTICLHHNRWNANDLENFENNIIKFKKNIIDLNSALALYPARRISIRDIFDFKARSTIIHTKKYLINFINFLRGH